MCNIDQCLTMLLKAEFFNSRSGGPNFIKISQMIDEI